MTRNVTEYSVSSYSRFGLNEVFLVLIIVSLLDFGNAVCNITPFQL